jgi:hypothetical protein
MTFSLSGIKAQALQQQVMLTSAQQTFEEAAADYADLHAEEIIQMLKDQPHDHDHGHEHPELSEDELMSSAREQARHDYIRQHMEEYIATYFGSASMRPSITINTACDNGGFENGFSFYDGFEATYRRGSDSCVAVDNANNPVTFLPIPLPSIRQFELVSPGIDPFVGIEKVRFGNQALKVNSEYDKLGNCGGTFGVNRLVKSFVVTEETRDLTVWFAAALENPAGHNNQQPYLRIYCDRAPDDEVCFDSDQVRCDSMYLKPGCGTDTIWEVDVIDWSCHRLKIPAIYVDSIATLTIEIGDCGQGAHTGYAYIDGICEDCATSSLGSVTMLADTSAGGINSIQYQSCDGSVATICGTYTDPNLCVDFGNVTFFSPQLSIQNIVIDTAKKSYCYDIPISNFSGPGDCIEFWTEMTFTGTDAVLPNPKSANGVICYDDYQALLTADILDIDYYSCNEDTVSVCVRYSIPERCKDWLYAGFELVPELDITGVEHDATNGTLCFDVLKSNFEIPDNCIFLDMTVTFQLGISNTFFDSEIEIEVCEGLFYSPEINFGIQACNSNTDPDDGNISDDYYFVQLVIDNVPDYSQWTIRRQLIDPYDNESGLTTILEGTGALSTDIGQFLVQEGDWYLIVEIDGCTYDYYITAPPYCSGCEIFHNVKIGNVTCNDDGTWSFDIMVPGDPTKQYTLEGLSRDFSKTYAINAGPITLSCLTYTLEYVELCGEDNTSTFIICPPQPCNPELECGDLEVSVREVLCANPDEPYSPVIDIDYAGSKYLCFGTVELGTPQLGSSSSGSMTSGGQQIGPFSGDIFFTIYECDHPCSSSNCSPVDPKCFKTIYIPDPDVCPSQQEGRQIGAEVGTSEAQQVKHQVTAYPNPTDSDQVKLTSTYAATQYAIYTLQGEQVLAGKFTSNQIVLRLDQPAGLYIVRCSDGGTNQTVLKVIKL